MTNTNSSVVCANCGSANLRKKGTSSTGAQRYLCKDCGKSFTENSSVSVNTNKISQSVKTESVQPTNTTSTGGMECPKCHSKSKFTKKGVNAAQQQRYKCSVCGCSFVPEASTSQSKVTDQKVESNNEIVVKSKTSSSEKNAVKVWVNGSGVPISIPNFTMDKLNKICESVGGTATLQSDGDYKINISKGTKN